MIAKKRTAGAGRHLSLFERQRIASLRDHGHEIREIARRFGRSPSTVSRELARNTRVWDGGYDPVMAHLRAHGRARRPKAGKIEQSPWLRSFIQDRLNRHWSPEQIHLHLRRHHGANLGRQVSVETIYECLYRPREDGLSRALTRQLRTGRSMRRRQRRVGHRACRFLVAMLSIHDRPLQAQERSQPGHWEGDLIIGAGGQSSIGTLVEWTSRKTRLVHLSGDRTAATVTPAIIKSLRTVPSHMRRSLTWDQGTEMAEHDLISHAFCMPVYFCDPVSPWQRATHENTNGLLRQYFPKGTDLSAYTPAESNAKSTHAHARPSEVGPPTRSSTSSLPYSTRIVATTARNHPPPRGRNSASGDSFVHSLGWSAGAASWIDSKSAGTGLLGRCDGGVEKASQMGSRSLNSRTMYVPTRTPLESTQAKN